MSLNYSLFDYLKQGLMHPTKTGSFAPSSEELSTFVVNEAELEKASVVIELGSGTGVMTEKILQKLPADATFFAMEINPEFAQVTKARCPKAVVYNDSAENVKEYMEKHGVTYCDCIISTLPWSVFSSEFQDKLITLMWDILAPGGRFYTVVYLHAILLPSAQRFKKRLEGKFREVKRSKVVWNNFPPAFAYCAKK